MAFSLSEEVDIFYCHKKNSLVFDNVEYDSQMIKEKLISLADTLENRREGPLYAASLQQLYIFSMGQYKSKEALPLKERKLLSNKLINEVTSIHLICQILNYKMSKLPQVIDSSKEIDNSNPNANVVPQNLYLE